MKKIISVLLVVVLVFALCTIPASAATNKSEWQKQNGPGKLEFNEQGVKCVLDTGLTFFKYTKETIDVKNFTCTFIPHYEKMKGSFYAITLTGTKSYAGPGSNGLFLLFRLMDNGVVNVEGQILHVGYYLTGEPPHRNKDIQVDTSKPLTVKGVDNGNGTYTVSFEGGTGEYTFEIPENYQFTEDYNGEGYFSFGGSCGETEQRAITVVSVNGIDFSGNKPEPESTSKPTSSSQQTTSDSTDADDGLIIDADDTTTTATGDDTNTESGSNSTLIIVIIVCGVLVLGAVAAVAVIVIKKKKTSELPEQTGEDSAE